MKIPMKNNMEIIAFVGMLILVAIIVIALVFWKIRSRKLSGSSKKRVVQAWQNALSLQDAVRRIMEADAVLDLALKELGFQGSLGEKLQKAGARFKDVDAVWRAHKLRNRVAHEAGVNISDREVDIAMKAFERALDDLY